MNQSPIELLPGPCIVVGNSAVFLRPAQGLDLAEQLARLSFRKALAEEAEAFEASSNDQEDN